MVRIVFLVFGFAFFTIHSGQAQSDKGHKIFSHADTVRGSITPERAWWNVIRYDISITPDYQKQFISGSNGIRFNVLRPGRIMQIDLQEPMKIVSVTWRNIGLKFKRAGNAYYITFPETLKQGETSTLELNFVGKPRVAGRPPWDGGWIWTKDKQGRPWMSVACQGLGASVWYPCKDHQSDEPDSGASLSVTVPDTLIAVANGRLTEKKVNGNGTATYIWAVVNPINNYNIIPYIGKYVSWHEDYPGEKGKLDCDYWVLDYNLEKAKEQFKQVDKMLHCFEYWMGPYPFYEDGYKLVEAPHLGMEHQSAIAYGNDFKNGYKGRDLSGTGWGLKWDFIIIHESGHEWWGNSITSNDVADMWVHEGFTNYTETLFTSCEFGVEAGNEYCIGTRKLIQNDKPIIAPYGVNEEGSGDMYYKGGNMLHMIRQIVSDDSLFRALLHGLNETFYHQTVSGRQIEDYISQFTQRDFSKVFDQYLRTTKVPVLEYRVVRQKAGEGMGSIFYRWANCVKGFNMPVKTVAGNNSTIWISPTENWKRFNLVLPGNGSAGPKLAGDVTRAGEDSFFSVDQNFYIKVKRAY